MHTAVMALPEPAGFLDASIVLVRVAIAIIIIIRRRRRLGGWTRSALRGRRWLILQANRNRWNGRRSRWNGCRGGRDNGWRSVCGQIGQDPTCAGRFVTDVSIDRVDLGRESVVRSKLRTIGTILDWIVARKVQEGASSCEKWLYARKYSAAMQGV